LTVQLQNDTPFAARLLRFQRAEEAPVNGALVLKATFQRDPSGCWVPAAEQLPLVDAPLPTAFGIFHGDNFMRKDGVDVCVMGTVRPSRPRRALEVTVSIGGRRSSLVAYGDRRWVRNGRQGLIASVPEPFDEMPVSYERAYGGKTVHDFEEVVFADNPVGRGYYLSEVEAEGRPLANLEAAGAAPVRSWSDRPAVCAWGPYPCFWALRAREAVTPDPDDPRAMPRISPRLNNNAHPDLIVPALPEVGEIRIDGMRPGELVYRVPQFAVRLSVESGGAVIAEPDWHVDGLFVWADLDHFTVTARAHFTYPYDRGQVRRARLWLGD
jgi:hypothetical protein